MGDQITIATPLGLGKPVKILNSFYEYACKNSQVELSILTALSLTGLTPSSDLEARLVDPINERLFGDYPDLQYAYDRDQGELPDNVTIREFYVRPGSQLNNPNTQQNYVSTNYTHAVRDTLNRNVNVLAQLVTPAKELHQTDEPTHSLSCNPDLTLDMLDQLEESPNDYVCLGEVNGNLPYMYGDCLLPTNKFDFLLDDDHDYKLFGPPSKPVNDQDYAIGLHASQLIKDGGTLQVGIGSLSEALTKMLIMRHNDNRSFKTLRDKFPIPVEPSLHNDDILCSDTFRTGLYGATEMFVRGFEELYRAGILSRQVYDHPVLQEYVNHRNQNSEVTMELLDRLCEEGYISDSLTEDDLSFLKDHGIVVEGVRRNDDQIVLPDGSSVPAQLTDPKTREQISAQALGEELRGGVVVDAGFFLGPESMYEFLRNLDAEDRKKIHMNRISYVNQLYGNENLKRLQRRNARFVNSAMKVSALGAVTSDGLQDMRVLSGVGGQYNFVAMAHELQGGRSVILVPSTRQSEGDVESNIVWNYGHTTIPRHLRDIVVTEYGIADIRGRSDQEVIESMLSVTDARFQERIVERAKDAGKLPTDWKLPQEYKKNTPERLQDWAKEHLRSTDASRFPFGSELTEEEMVLIQSLRKLKKSYDITQISLEHLNAFSGVLNSPDEAKPYLERMNLYETTSWEEYVLQKVVLYALGLTNTFE